MTTTSIRKRLMSYIADADEKKIKGLYMLIEDDLNNQNFQLSDDQIQLLEEEKEAYMKGKTKSYSWTEAKKIIKRENK